MRLREAWPVNVWLRRTAALAAGFVAEAGVTGLWPLPGAWELVPPSAVFAAYLPCAVMAVRTNMRLADQRHTAELEAARDAAEAEALRTLAAPDAGPDQCPVCGGEELAELADDDELLGRGPDWCKVVPYGPRQRAHWACADFVPYQPTAQDKAVERNRERARTEQHLRSMVVADATARAALAQRVQRIEAEGARPRLIVAPIGGQRHLFLDRAPQHPVWLLQDAGRPHSEIVVIRSGSESASGYHAVLSSGLRHDFPASTLLVPIDWRHLWSPGAGRVYTDAELGLCDCRCGSYDGGLVGLVERGVVPQQDMRLRLAWSEHAGKDLLAWGDASNGEVRWIRE